VRHAAGHQQDIFHFHHPDFAAQFNKKAFKNQQEFRDVLIL
jgi:hypothetical protein